MARSFVAMACPMCGELIPDAVPLPAVNQGDTVTYLPNSFEAACRACGRRFTLPEGASFGNVDPDGRWVSELLDLLRPPGVTVEDYTTLRELLRDARSDVDTSALAARIRADVPAFRRLADAMGSRASGNLAAWITVVLACIAIVLAPSRESEMPRGQTDVTTNNFTINNVVVTNITEVNISDSGTEPLLPRDARKVPPVVCFRFAEPTDHGGGHGDG